MHKYPRTPLFGIDYARETCQQCLDMNIHKTFFSTRYHNASKILYSDQPPLLLESEAATMTEINLATGGIGSGRILEDEKASAIKQAARGGDGDDEDWSRTMEVLKHGNDAG